MELTARRGVITGGTWCLDRNKMIDRWPGEDQVAEIVSEEARGGGSGCNLAVDMRKLDPTLPVETIALVGDDADGRFLMAEADQHGIDRRQMHVTRDAPTHYTDAFGSRASGRRTHIYNAGAAHLLTPDHFDLSQTRARFLHLGLPGTHRLMDAAWGEDANGWVAVLKKARAAGLETNLELMSAAPAVIAALTRPCLPHLDLLIVNDVEIGAIAGEPSATDGATDVEACVRAARHVLEAGAMAVVAVHFPMGAIAVTRGGALFKRPSVAVPASEIAAANGAGDAFASGLLYGLHEGWPIADALSLAHAVAAASLRGLSTTGTVETWQRCLTLAEAWGARAPL